MCLLPVSVRKQAICDFVLDSDGSDEDTCGAV
jgi:hypothetical protein